jgi:O-antigen/teichoic acid export membrane protein
VPVPHPARELLGKLFSTRLGTNILSLYAVQGLSYLLPLLVLPYLLRVLGPDGYGSVAFAQALLGYAVMLTDYGFNLSATRAISLARDNPAELARIFWATLTAKFLLLLVSALVLVPVVALVPQFREQWQVFAVCGLMVVGSCAFPQWYFQGLERMRAVATIQAVTRLIAFVATFVFVRSSADRVVAAAILSMPTAIAALLCAVAIKSIAPVGGWRPNVRDVCAAFTGNWHLFVSIAAGTLYLNTNAFLLGLLSGTYAVALYTLANKVALAVFNLFGPIFQATFPRASVAFGQSGPAGRRFVWRLAVLLLPVATLISLLLVVFAPIIIRVAAGGGYTDAIPVLRIMGVLPLLLTAGTLLAQTVMINAGLSQALSRVYVAVGILNLAILPVLILTQEAAGAAASLVIAELVGPILMFVAIRRRRVFAAAGEAAAP